MQDAFWLTENLLGREGTQRLSRAKIIIFGLGGVGSYAAEALARCGVASLTLVDPGTVEETGINRQIFAMPSTVGRSKVELMKERIRGIDEDILVHTYETFFQHDTSGMFDLQLFDYVIDATDTVSSKLLLIEKAKKAGVPVISCMDTDNKLDPGRLEITDISRTLFCPMAKLMRSELRKKGIRRVKVLYSKEHPSSSGGKAGKASSAAGTGHGSISFVCGTAGFLIAGEVVRDLVQAPKRK